MVGAIDPRIQQLKSVLQQDSIKAGGDIQYLSISDQNGKPIKPDQAWDVLNNGGSIKVSFENRVDGDPNYGKIETYNIELSDGKIVGRESTQTEETVSGIKRKPGDTGILSVFSTDKNRKENTELFNKLSSQEQAKVLIAFWKEDKNLKDYFNLKDVKIDINTFTICGQMLDPQEGLVFDSYLDKSFKNSGQEAISSVDRDAYEKKLEIARKVVNNVPLTALETKIICADNTVDLVEFVMDISKPDPDAMLKMARANPRVADRIVSLKMEREARLVADLDEYPVQSANALQSLFRGNGKLPPGAENKILNNPRLIAQLDDLQKNRDVNISDINNKAHLILVAMLKDTARLNGFEDVDHFIKLILSGNQPATESKNFPPEVYKDPFYSKVVARHQEAENRLKDQLFKKGYSSVADIPKEDKETRYLFIHVNKLSEMLMEPVIRQPMSATTLSVRSRSVGLGLEPINPTDSMLFGEANGNGEAANSRYQSLIAQMKLQGFTVDENTDTRFRSLTYCEVDQLLKDSELTNFKLDDRKVILVTTPDPKSDWNGAFIHDNRISDFFQQGYRVVYSQVGQDSELFSKIETLGKTIQQQDPNRNIAYVSIGGHGTPKTTQVGNDEMVNTLFEKIATFCLLIPVTAVVNPPLSLALLGEALYLNKAELTDKSTTFASFFTENRKQEFIDRSTLDIGDMEKIRKAGLGQYFGSMILDSCSTAGGKNNGLVAALAEATGRPVFGPELIASSIRCVFDKKTGDITDVRYTGHIRRPRPGLLGLLDGVRDPDYLYITDIRCKKIFP